MRIAYLVNQYPKTSHTFVRREIRALEAEGLTIDRFTVRRVDEPLPDPDDQAELALTTALLDDRAGLAVAALRAARRAPLRVARALRTTITLGRRSERGLARHLAYLAEAARLTAELEARGITHVHAHFGSNSAAVALLYHELSGGTYSFTVHGPEEFDHPDELSLDRKIASAEFVVAVSEYGRSQLYRWCDHEHWPKIQVVHCAVEASFLAEEPAPIPDTARLVCIGRLCEQKGQLLLVEAAIEVAKDRRFELVFVGDGDFRQPMQELIDQHDLGRSIRILGWRSGAEVRDELRRARAMVLPSFAEGLPVGIMEALALGRPVISTYVAGIPELVEPGRNGWLVPAGSVPALVEALTAAIDAEVADLTAMGRAGRDDVAARHHDRTEAATLARLFAGVPGVTEGGDA